MDVVLHMLGRPRLVVGDDTVRVDTRKALVVLARILLEGPQHRAVLADLLWPDSGTKARGALRRTLSTLRSALPPGLLVDQGDVVSVPDGAVDTDLALDEPGPDASAEELAEAVDRTAGRFLDGLEVRGAPTLDTWVAAVDERRQRRHLSLLGRLSDALAANGDLEGAVEVARRRLALDPLQEAGYRQLILLHTWRGDRGAVTDAYLSCVRALDEALGVSPLEDTEALYRAALSGELPPPPTGPVPPAAEAATGRDALLPFVGRGRVMTALLADDPAGGLEGNAVLVTGPSGVGKTRLLHEAGQSPAVERAVTVRCEQAETPLAYAPVVALLRELGADHAPMADHLAAEVGRLLPRPGPLPEPLVSRAGQTRFVDALCTVVLDLLDTGPGRSMLCVDDVHHADDESRALLAYLLRRTAGRPVTVVLAATTGAGHAEVNLDARTIDLSPLRVDDVAEIVSGLGLTVEAKALWDLTGGMPYRLAARIGGDDLSAVDEPDVVRQRVQRCGELAQQVLTAAAVIGRPATPRLLVAASGRTEEEVVLAADELLRHGLATEIQSPELALALQHERLAEVVLTGVSLTRRRLLHSRIANALMAQDPPVPAAVLAEHLAGAGRDDEAAVAHYRAGRRALHLFANADAIAHLDAALALDRSDPTGTLLDLAVARTRLGDYRSARSALAQARAQVTDARLRGVVEHRLGALRLREGDPAGARVHLEEARLAPLDVATAARVAVDLAISHLRLGAVEEADAQLAEARAAVDGDDVPPEVAAWTANVAAVVARHRGDLETAAQELDTATMLSGEDVLLHAAVLNNRALLLAATGDVDGAVEAARAALESCTSAGDRHLRAAVTNNLADLLHSAGRSDEAREVQTEAAALFAGVGASDGALSPGIWQLVDW